MTDQAALRQPSATERRLFDRLLEPEFLGRYALREQLRGCLIRTVDENGSLRFLARSHAAEAPTKWRIPVEGEIEDEDGVTIHVLLHVLGGRADELEIYKDDPLNALLSKIDPSPLELFCPPLVR